MFEEKKKGDYEKEWIESNQRKENEEKWKWEGRRELIKPDVKQRIIIL